MVLLAKAYIVFHVSVHSTVTLHLSHKVGLWCQSCPNEIFRNCMPPVESLLVYLKHLGGSTGLLPIVLSIKRLRAQSSTSLRAAPVTANSKRSITLGNGIFFSLNSHFKSETHLKWIQQLNSRFHNLQVMQGSSLRSCH